MLPAAGSVYLGGLVEVRRDVHQDACDYQHQVRNTDPDVDENDGDPRPHRLGEEGQRLRDPTPPQ